MQIGLRSTKSIEEYRHNIKLLKYHLKKQERINETLKYKKMKHTKKAQNQEKHLLKEKDRVYLMSDTIIKLSIRLKNMGLTLGDIFRMADSTYEGQVTKEQFLKCIVKINHDDALDEGVVNEMFYAIDTNLNGILDEDEYMEFLCAYGGTDSKEARKFQKKSLEKLVAYLKKKGFSKAGDFIIDLVDPIKASDLKQKFIGLGHNENEAMILLKAFDPSNEGKISHELFVCTMQNVKQKSEQEIKNEQMEKDIKELCVEWRQSKINPIKIFEEADIDKKDGVTPIQLEQAFKKLMPGQTSFQIKKWVGLINLNNDKEITREEFLNSIRSFYSLNQMQKFSSDYEKENPNSKKNLKEQDFPQQKILQELSEKIQDSKMTKKQVFESIDINKNGSLDKEELFDGLKGLGLNVLFVGRVIAVFDRNSDGDINMQEWLHILGEDVAMEEVDIPDFSDFSDDQEEEKGKKTVKKAMNKLTGNKKAGDKSQNKGTVSQFHKKEQSKNESTKPSMRAQKKQTKTFEEDVGGQRDLEEKKQPKLSTNKKEQIQDKKSKKTTEKVQKSVRKVQEVVSAQPKKKEQVKIKNTESKLIVNANQGDSQEQNYGENEFENQVKIKEVVATQYKKTPIKVLSYFEKRDSSKRNTLKYQEYVDSLKQIFEHYQMGRDIGAADLEQSDVRCIFEEVCIEGGSKVNYKEWLQQISKEYASDVKNQEPGASALSKKQSNDKLEEGGKNSQSKDEFLAIGDLVSKHAAQKSQSHPTNNRGVQSHNLGEEFKLLDSLISKQGEYVEEGYKFHNYLDVPQQMDLLRKEYLPKAESLKKNKKLFTDAKFPCKASSISQTPGQSKIANVKTLEWKHYKEIFSEPKLFEGSIEPNDIKQGGLGNCYFLSALACLAEYSNLIERLFEYYDLESGYFLIWLCIDGEWKLIEVDGNIVAKNSQGKYTPAFTQTTAQELWVILLEKAYAKAYGSYENIVGGLPFEAIKDLSGSPGQSMNNNKFPYEEIWAKLCEANQNKEIMAAGTQQDGSGDASKLDGHTEGITKEGIVLGHAYSILDVQEVGQEKIIQLRNPWGKIEWNGDWSDKSSKWTVAIKKKLNYDNSNQDDGIFWMPFLEFYKRYGTTSINYIRPTNHYQSYTEPSVKSLLIRFPSSSNIDEGFFMISQKDHRHQGLPPTVPYTYINIISFVCSRKTGKVIRKISDKRYLYQREASVELSKIAKDQEPLIVAILQKNTDVTLAYYGSKKDQKFETTNDSREISTYLEKLAHLEEDKGQKMGDLLCWMADIGDRAFLCFKNISESKREEYVIETSSPNNIKIEPPQGEKNKLVIPYGQIKAVRGLIVNRKDNFSFGSISYS